MKRKDELVPNYEHCLSKISPDIATASVDDAKLDIHFFLHSIKLHPIIFSKKKQVLEKINIFPDRNLMGKFSVGKRGHMKWGGQRNVVQENSRENHEIFIKFSSNVLMAPASLESNFNPFSICASAYQGLSQTGYFCILLYKNVQQSIKDYLYTCLLPFLIT